MTQLTLDDAQKLVDNWIKAKGVRYFNELTNMTLLVEEVGELARIMARRYGEQSFKEGETDHDPAPEMADILFVLICLANQTGINLTQALLQSIEKKTKRDSERHQGNTKLL
ncbi:MAG: nucleotide pyrophosphohydrolase [Tenuifilum sp.]|uniref:nucleotide pyrophosphohydrolase n=1 Tax=Tenuifilum sp. TaxID=2760880 RepID=UPI003CBB2474